EGTASLGMPYMEIINISPMNPPLGIPPATIDTSTVIPTAVMSVAGSKKFQSNIENATYIFRMDEIEDPFLYSVLPRGMTTLEICLGIPILSAARRFTGRVAKLLQVLNAVRDGETLCFQNVRIPNEPLAIEAYRVK